jgi:hypothetical protein
MMSDYEFDDALFALWVIVTLAAIFPRLYIACLMVAAVHAAIAAFAVIAYAVALLVGVYP